MSIKMRGNKIKARNENTVIESVYKVIAIPLMCY